MKIGMGKTTERKVEIAHKIYDICVNEYGLPPNALIFDRADVPNHDRAGGTADWLRIETLEGIKRIKAELPGVLDHTGRE